MTDKINIPCPICNFNKPKEIYHKDGRRIVRCRKCKFMYQNPRSLALIDTENKGNYYRQAYLAAALPHKKLFEEKFEEFLPNDYPGKILDIGCATGQFLEVAIEKGWQAVGIDISEWSCTYLKEKGFENIHHSTLENANFPDEIFDAVHMNHVLEHIPAPQGFLSEVHRILKPGGRIIIEVPNEAYFPANYMLINALMPKDTPPRQIPKSHLSLFTKKTLCNLLETNNFNIETLRIEGFSTKSRTTTPVFKNKTWIVKSALFMCRLRLDVFWGLGRYLVAAAGKKQYLTESRIGIK